MIDNNRNFILAIVLSMAVLFGWQFFIAGPEIDRARQQQAIDARRATDGAAQNPAAIPAQPTGGLPGVATPVPHGTRAEAIARSERVAIDTPRLSGSINLTGARIDDLRLNEFHETVDPASPTIVLLSPAGGPDSYFAEFGWIGPADAGPLPGPDTRWTAPANARLTVAAPLTLSYDNGAGLVFSRQIAIDADYMFTVSDTVANRGTRQVDLAPFGRVTRIGEPVVAGYWILHEGLIGVLGGDGLQEYTYSAIKKEREKTWNDVTQGWIGITDKYWAAALVPDQAKPFTARYVHAELPQPLYQTDFRGAALSIAPGTSATQASRLFAGAKQVAIVDGYRDTFNIKLFDRLIDWGWFWFFTKPLFYLMDFFFRLFGNFGVAILAVTVVVKAAFFPLANKSYRSMSAMKKVQPQMTALREQFKDDKVKQQQALMELYKKEKINPLAGCWPIAIQIPVFFALYKVLFVTIEMRHAPFFGWIKDLASPDPTHVFNLFGLLPYDPSAIPVIGAFLAIGLWPVLMGITMFVQMKLNPTPPDKTQAMIFTWMPVLFTFMLAGFPAGLVIYWAWNNALSVTQQYVIMKRYGAEVNLFGNILDTFRKKPAQPAATPAGTAAVTVPQAANDSVKPPEPPPAKSTVKSRRAAAKAKSGAKAKG